MPSPRRNDEPTEVAYTRLDFEAMAAAGDIEIIEPGTPEAAAFDREMVNQLDEYNADLIEREGPDALTSDRQLRQAAVTAEQDPRYVAHALADARARLVADRAGLASWLGIGPNQLAALGLESRPDPSAPTFTDRVRELAKRYGVNADRLADALG